MRTSMPCALPIDAQRSPKLPATSASIVSPGDSTFTSAASIAPVPEHERIRTSSLVFRNVLSPATDAWKTARNSSVR